MEASDYEDHVDWIQAREAARLVKLYGHPAPLADWERDLLEGKTAPSRAILADSDGTVVDLLADDSDFSRDVRAVLAEAGDLLLRKHHDYGPKNISGAPGGPLNGIRVRLYDKLARLNNLVDSDSEPNFESIEDTLVDALNYCAIALLVVRGKWPE